MATLSYGSLSYEVDHAVKGANYVHGYDVKGKLIVAFDGVTNFSGFSYTGTYMNPESCISEACNDAKYVDGSFMKRDGTPIDLAPAYTYGTEDLVAGVTELESGKLHFVYE